MLLDASFHRHDGKIQNGLISAVTGHYKELSFNR
jgi:hypothetical protein